MPKIFRPTFLSLCLPILLTSGACRTQVGGGVQECPRPLLRGGTEPSLAQGVYDVQVGLVAAKDVCPGDHPFIFQDSLTLPDSGGFYPFPATLPLLEGHQSVPLEGLCDGVYPEDYSSSGYAGGYGYGQLCLGRSDNLYRPDPDIDAAYEVEVQVFLEFDLESTNRCGSYDAFIGSIEARAVGACQGTDCADEPGLGTCMQSAVISGTQLEAM